MVKFFERIPARGRIVFLHDVAMSAFAFILALYLRLGEDWLFYGSELAVEGTGLFTVICALVFWKSGLYRGVWRYASLNDLIAITKAVTVAILIFVVAAFIWSRLATYPRSLPFLVWLVLIALLGGPRFFYRMLKDRRYGLPTLETGRTVPVLLVGASDGTELFIRSLGQTGQAGYRVVGILATSENRIGRHIHGIEVGGGIDDLEKVVTDLGKRGDRPQRLLITKDNLDGATVRDLFERAQQLGLTLGRLPKLTDFKSGAADKVEVRPIAVEDLLGRPQTVLDRAGMSRLIEGRPVLVTGAGGSIGAELVRQVAALKPSRLVLLDSSEFALYRIDLELSEQEGSPDHPALLADVRDGTRLEQIFSRYRPEVVFHAAALKHVPLVEANPFEGLRTNCLGTLELARAARRHGARAMVMISTDKAVNPTNIMGASKRIAEMITQANDLDSESPTRFVTVRFGNVLGSTGSVVPLFQRQLARGGPLTVTHPDMKRYFMTIREAVELVLQASVHALLVHDGKVEPTGCIHVLDMGEPVRILDLAEQMVRLAGREPGRDIEIKFTGLRPGEKLFEEIFHGSEELKESGVDGVFVAHPRALQRDALYAALEQLAQACQSEDHDRLIDLVQGLVPEYQPSQT